MFRVEGTRITLSRGDTGSLLVKSSGHTFTSDDRALFTVANRNGSQILMQQEYELTDGNFTVLFLNEVTDQWPAGNYKWEVRYIINPTRTEGVITGGTDVFTPMEPQDLIVSAVIGEV